MMVSLIEAIDTSKLTELTVTDVFSMMIPRIVIEYKERGADMGRETMLREVLGTLDSNFFAGWVGFAFLKLFQHGSFSPGRLLNPLNLRHSDWIQNKNLEVFGQILSKHLQNPMNQTSNNVMHQFVTEILQGVEATDGISRQVQFKKHSKSPITGRLVSQSRKDLTSLLLSRNIGASTYYEKTFLPGIHGIDGRLPRQKARLEWIQKLASEGELTSEVRVLGRHNKHLIGEISRDSLFKELKAFIDHYAARLLPLHPEKPLTAVMRESALLKLNGGQTTRQLTSWLPKAGEGLIPYAQKSKWYLSLVPLILATVISVSISWFNRWYTQRKHGGETFFPGEKVFEQPGGNASKAPSRFDPRQILARFRGNSASLAPAQNGLLHAFDFERPGVTTTPMNMTIYGSNILSRLAAARTANEFWENLRRDGLGWACWFYTTPIVQRLVVRCSPKHVREALLTENPKPVTGLLQKLNWQVNPLMRWHLTSSNQILDYLNKPQYAKEAAFLNELRLWRTGASAVGLLMALFVLGIGINLVNIAITKANVLSGQKPQNPDYR
jgi:hypothetical protein